MTLECAFDKKYPMLIEIAKVSYLDQLFPRSATLCSECQPKNKDLTMIVNN